MFECGFFNGLYSGLFAAFLGKGQNLFLLKYHTRGAIIRKGAADKVLKSYIDNFFPFILRCFYCRQKISIRRYKVILVVFVLDCTTNYIYSDLDINTFS